MARKYPSYKDCNIEWIGGVPEHWKITRLANFGIFLKGRGITKADLTEEGVPVVLYGDIYTKYNFFTEKFERKTSFENAQRAVEVFGNDLLFTASGETKEDIGKCIVYLGNDEAYASGDVIIFRQNANSSKFLGYVFNSYYINVQKAKLSKGEIVIHVYSSQLRNIHFALPPLHEQTQIATYLDQKTIQLDVLITKKEQLIQLLEEERTAIINQAVTKGLDPNAKMKDSGIDWLGEIPENWEVLPLKYLVLINSKSLSEKTPEDCEINYIEIGNVNVSNGVEEYTKYLFKNAPSRARRILSDGDVLVSTVRTYLKAITSINAEYEGYIASTGFAVLTPQKIISDFLGILVRNEGFIGEIISLSKGVSYPSITTQDLGSIKIPLPSGKEQVEIAESIKNGFSRIDKVLGITNKEIEYLKEYKTTLINEVVTGKIDVREQVLP